MDNLRPRTALFLGLRLVIQLGGLHDVAKGEKGRRVGVAFRIAVTQRLIVSIQDGALGTSFFIVLQGTAGTFGAALTGSFHPFSTILSVALALPVCLPIGFYFVGVGISPRLCILVHGFSIIAPPVATIFPNREAVFFSPFTHIFPACVLCFIGQNKSFLSKLVYVCLWFLLGVRIIDFIDF